MWLLIPITFIALVLLCDRAAKAHAQKRVEQALWRARFRAREDEIICRGIELATKEWLDC